MRYIAFYAILVIAAALLTGCATPETKVEVVADSWCRVAKKLTWSLQDTQETIDGIRRHNAKVDACTTPRVS